MKLLCICLTAIFGVSVRKENAAETGQKCALAEKEVVKVDSRIHETSLSLAKYQRDRDCKIIDVILTSFQLFVLGTESPIL